MELRVALNVLTELRALTEAGYIRGLDHDTGARAILEMAPVALDKATYLLERFARTEAEGTETEACK